MSENQDQNQLDESISKLEGEIVAEKKKIVDLKKRIKSVVGQPSASVRQMEYQQAIDKRSKSIEAMEAQLKSLLDSTVTEDDILKMIAGAETVEELEEIKDDLPEETNAAIEDALSDKEEEIMAKKATKKDDKKDGDEEKKSKGPVWKVMSQKEVEAASANGTLAGYDPVTKKGVLS